jgi:hypothetical protein
VGRIPNIVLVKQRDEVSLRVGNASVARRRLATVRLAEYCRPIPHDPSSNLGAPISGPVIDDDDRVGRSRLPEDAPKSLLDECRPIVERDDDGDPELGCVHRADLLYPN